MAKNNSPQENLSIQTEMHEADSSMVREKVTIGFCVVVGAVLLLMEIYVMLHLPDQFLLMGFLVIPFALDLYVLVNSTINLSLINKRSERVKFEELYRAEKASYLIIKKSFDEMQQRLNDIEQASELPADDIINVQKAVAKVTISRNKENAMALMDSNNRLIEQIEELKAQIESINKDINEKQEKLLDKTKDDLVKKNESLERQLDRLHDAIRNQPVQSAPQYIMAPMAAAPAATVATPRTMPTPQPVAEPVAPVVEPVEEEPVEEDPVEEEPLVEEFLVEPEAELEPEVAPEPEPEPEPAPAPEVQLSDDPNHKLSADEIAALFNASNNAASAEEAAPEADPAPEPEPEPIPEPTPEPEPEPAPAADPLAGLDTSDPNKVLSPEEIEKLFSNL